MWPAPCSWRTRMWRMLLSSSGSYAGRMQPPGRPNMTSVPSISSDLIRAWAPVIFMVCSVWVACAANLPRKLQRPPEWEARDARADVDVRLVDEYELGGRPNTHRQKLCHSHPGDATSVPAVRASPDAEGDGRR